jgi:hypothetical protein
MKKPKRPSDVNRLAKSIVEIATGEKPEAAPEKHAGQRRGGLKGAAARKAALSPEERTEIARAAASARWKKGG